MRNIHTTIEDFDDADNDTYQYATHYSYDIHGNVDRLVQENPGLDDFGDNNRFKLIEYEYDLISGNVNKVHYQSGKEDQFHHKYYYDADNRLLAVFTSRDNHIWDKDARYFYYRHGPLARTEIGDLKVQGVDYAYTIHGWLKGVNATALNTAKDMGKDAKYAGPLSSSNSYVGSDAFGFVLDYYKGDYNRINTSAPDFVATQQSGGTYYTYYDPSNSTAPDLWNGNIRGMSTALMDPDHVKVDVLGKSYQYDQLNRIKKSYSFEKASMDIAANFTWVGVSASNNWNTEYTYDPNGNITTMKRSGNANTAYDMDQFTYHYYQGTENSNRLKYVSDAATGTYSEDIDDQTGAATDNKNYEYDDIGNLTKDVTGDLEDIKWTVYGKIREIEKGDGTILTFAYDPMGQRIMKKVDPTSGNTVYTYYLRDAQGNNMATYERIEAETTDELFLTEQYVYGSSRVGYLSLNYEMVDATPSTTNFVRKLGEKRYELSNHLGNVLAVLSDRLFAYQEASPYTNYVKYYEADVIAAQDYDPFGMLTPGRHWEAGSGYRHGFNGKEQDAETYGNGNEYDYGFRIYNPRLGKFLSADPLTSSYPWYTPYQFAGNKPIWAVDLDGLEELIFTKSMEYIWGKLNEIIPNSELLSSYISKISDPNKAATTKVYFVAMQFSNDALEAYTANIRELYTNYLSYLSNPGVFDKETATFMEETKKAIDATGLSEAEILDESIIRYMIVVNNSDEMGLMLDKYKRDILKNKLKAFFHEIDAHLINDLEGESKPEKDEHAENIGYYNEGNQQEYLEVGFAEDDLENGVTPLDDDIVKVAPESPQGKINVEVDSKVNEVYPENK